MVPLAPQPGWRFKGFKFYTVQDLVVETRVVRYWRPCYRTPEGRLVIAPLPPEVTGHFGANLVRYLLSQHYQCRVTMPLLRQQLQDVGILISAGQISNLLTKGHEAFHAEKAAVKQAGLETARWISVDDTGARHLGINGVTTQIGDDRFTSFDTVAAKSRLMFLMTLRGAFQDYVINAAALLYLHEQDAPEILIERLIEPRRPGLRRRGRLDRPPDRARDHRRQGGAAGQRGRGRRQPRPPWPAPGRRHRQRWGRPVRRVPPRPVLDPRRASDPPPGRR